MQSWLWQLGHSDATGVTCCNSSSSSSKSRSKPTSVAAHCVRQRWQLRPAASGKPRRCVAAGVLAAVACGPQHAVLIDTSGAVLVVGNGTSGQLGLGDSSSHMAIMELPGSCIDNGAVLGVACGGYHTCLIVQPCSGGANSKRILYAMGSNESGQLVCQVCGQWAGALEEANPGVPHHQGFEPATWNVPVPQPVRGLGASIVSHVACGLRHTVVATDAGVIQTCGANSHGQVSGAWPLQLLRWRPRVMTLLV